MNDWADGGNRRVLVIDDNRSAQDDLRRILAPAASRAASGGPELARQMQFEVHSAYQGQEGFLRAEAALAAGEPYALIFLDVRISPGWDGLETSRKIGEIDPDTQIVLCAAGSGYPWEEMFEKLGRRDGLLVLKKPFDAVEVVQMAHALTAKWGLQQEARRKMAELERLVAELRRAEESLRLLGSAVEQAKESIVITGADLERPGPTIIFVNPAFTQMTGYTAAEAIGQSPRILQGPLTDRVVLSRLRQDLQQGKNFEGEAIQYRKDGTEYFQEWQIAPLRDAGGVITHFVSIQRDVTGRKRVEEELSWNAAFLEAQVNSSIDGILVVDAKGRKILQNQRTIDLLKIPQAIADDQDDTKQARWFMATTLNPEQVAAKIAHLYSHPNEISRDEVELKDGTVLERYSSPVVGKDGRYYGRIWTFRDITERRRAEDALRASNEKFNQLADNITDAFWIRSPDMSEVHYVSPAYERIWGRSVASLQSDPGMWSSFIVPEDRARVTGAFAALTSDAPSLDIDYRITRPDGEIRWVHVRGFQVRDAAKKLIRHLGIVSDITGRKRLETQLFQAQKMETVGKLAGGIAHEFNNILTAIIGRCELLLADLPAGSASFVSVTEISQAARRAAGLTRQLLAYGRKQFLRSEILDLNQVLAGMEGVLHPLIGAEVEMQVVCAPDLRTVKADVGQIEQVIMNLVINACDAMPTGGRLTLKTANVTLDEDYVSRFPESEVKAGDYVILMISDTGTGMSEEVKAHLFEPFFTTKGIGQGTGLGLSTCYGIIKQSGGHISAFSELGRGTTFRIYLPQVKLPPKISGRPDSPDLPGGTETILLVESEVALREILAGLLRRLGYTVLAAVDGREAMELKPPGDPGQIDLLFTPVVMPAMSGHELAERVRALYPLAKIIFAAGHDESAVTLSGLMGPGMALLKKPFTPSELMHKLREVLDRDGQVGSNAEGVR